jgi:hypothetical protein
MAGIHFSDTLSGFVELATQEVLLEELVHDCLELSNRSTITGTPNLFETRRTVFSREEAHGLFDNVIPGMIVVLIREKGGRENLIDDCTSQE